MSHNLGNQTQIKSWYMCRKRK